MNINTVNQIRQDISNIDQMIFLNSAGASLQSNRTLDSVYAYMKLEQELGGYAAFDHSQSQIEEFYNSCAKLINAKSHNIAYASSATFAFFQALSSFTFQKGDVIITSDDDYTSNFFQLITLHQRYGVEVKRIKNLSNGDLDLDHAETLFRDHPKLVVLSYVPSANGKIQNAQAIGKLAKVYDVKYILDACQAIGQLEVDVNDLQCDFLSVTGRKFLRGPRGTGFLFVSDEILSTNCHSACSDGRGALWTSPLAFTPAKDAKRFELFEITMAAIMGLSSALQQIDEIGMDKVASLCRDISIYTRTKLQEIDHIEILDDGSMQCNIITFRPKNRDMQLYKNILGQHNVVFSAAQKSSAFIDFDKKGVDACIRFSPHYFNTKQEIEKVIEILNDGFTS